MLFFGIKNSWFRLGIFLLLTILAASFIWRFYDSYYIADPYNPNLEGTARYGHNSEGDFKSFTRLTLIEYGILLVVLLPLSFSRFYWMRVLILGIAGGGWFFVMAVSGMHAGSVHASHTVWLFAVNIILFILLILSIVAEITGRREIRETANR